MNQHKTNAKFSKVWIYFRLNEDKGQINVKFKLS